MSANAPCRSRGGGTCWPALLAGHRRQGAICCSHAGTTALVLAAYCLGMACCPAPSSGRRELETGAQRCLGGTEERAGHDERVVGSATEKAFGCRVPSAPVGTRCHVASFSCVSSSARLVLMRHGETTWNQEGRMTGWSDVPLSTTGSAQARAAVTTLLDAGLRPQHIFTSTLQRARETARPLADLTALPLLCDWRFNERHLGVLEGLTKAQATAQFGRRAVKTWLHHVEAAPPALEDADPRHPRHAPCHRSVEPRYLPAYLPATESRAAVMARLRSVWDERLVEALAPGATVVIVGHSHQLQLLRALLCGRPPDGVLSGMKSAAPEVFVASRRTILASASLRNRRGADYGCWHPAPLLSVRR